MNIINHDKINTFSLQDCCFTSGIPDEIQGLRPLVWRILLGYLPKTTKDWGNHLDQQLEIYDSWKHELIIKPTIKYEEEKKE